MDFEGIINKISTNVPEPVEETYQGDDGLLRCKKCDGKRETIVTFLDKERKVRELLNERKIDFTIPEAEYDYKKHCWIFKNGSFLSRFF